MLLVIILFTVFLTFGMPLAFSIGISSLMFFIFNDNVPLIIPIQKMVSSTQSFPLLAVPFFVLAGNLMNATGITKRLVKFCITLTAHMTGGLAHVTILLSALMGGVSGSAVADVAMQSRLLGPTMVKQGYSKGYTAAAIGLSGLITATIPPSIGLILYGFVGEVSIGRLFIAGIVPGILMTLFMMGAAYFTAKHKGYKKSKDQRASFREVVEALRESIWALLFPIILIVGIRFGIFTPSEAGAFAVMYAFFIGKFVYKELTFEDLKNVLRQTVVDNGVIMLIISLSGIFGYTIVYDQVPQNLASLITGITTNPGLLLVLILMFLFVSGMFMEGTVNVLLLTPIFLPIVRSVGIDPVHFGILMMTIITMGGMTPPVGVAMFTACSLIDCTTEEYIKESIPFIGSVVFLIVVMTLFPSIVLFLPNLIYG